jgi:DNA gyrase subunit B
VKRGRSETYIKNERELEAYLIRRAVDGRVVKVSSTGAELSGAELEKALEKLIAHQKFMQAVERRGHPREIVEALLAAGADREFFGDKERLDRLAQAMTSEHRTVSVQRDEEHNRFLLQVEDRAGGYPRHHTIGVDFVTAGEYRTLLANRRDMPALAGELVVNVSADSMDDQTPEDVPAASSDGTIIGGAPADEATKLAAEPKDRQRKPGKAVMTEVRVKSLDELVDYFITAGKKGIAVNRYKGLGEMNPEQLWETTMDPGVRTLLQVRAEDHTEADLMFTTLMGDQVEPRRKFIEDNALDVKNLDV